MLGLLLDLIVPVLMMLPIYLDGDGDYVTRRGIENSSVGSLVAMVLAVLICSHVTSFPGIRAFCFMLATYAGTFGVVPAAFLALRIDYNPSLLAAAASQIPAFRRPVTKTAVA